MQEPYAVKKVTDNLVSIFRKEDPQAQKYTVDIERWTCSCVFSCSRLLPCRHVMCVRMQSNLQPIVPLLSLNKRWLLRNSMFGYDTVLAPCPNDRFQLKVRNGPKVLDKETKFQKLKILCLELCDILPLHGTSAFQMYFSALENVKEMALNGELLVVLRRLTFVLLPLRFFLFRLNEGVLPERCDVRTVTPTNTKNVKGDTQNVKSKSRIVEMSTVNVDTENVKGDTQNVKSKPRIVEMSTVKSESSKREYTEKSIRGEAGVYKKRKLG